MQGLDLPWPSTLADSKREPFTGDVFKQTRVAGLLMVRPLTLPNGQGLDTNAGLQQHVTRHVVQRQLGGNEIPWISAEQHSHISVAANVRFPTRLATKQHGALYGPCQSYPARKVAGCAQNSRGLKGLGGSLKEQGVYMPNGPFKPWIVREQLLKM